MSRITIVGGGISGLAAAHRLASEHEVIVLEAADRLGGCLDSTTLSGTVAEGIDLGAEASLHRRPETRELIAELGLDPVHPSREHGSQVLSRGGLRPIPRETIMGVPADPDTVAGLLGPEATARVAAEEVTAPIAGTDTSVGEFLAARLGDDLVDTLVDPLLAGVYAGRCRDLSLAATVPALLPAALDGTSVLDRAATLLVARAETAHTDPGGEPAPVFLSLPGGIGALIPALAEAITAAGGEIRTGSPVTGLSRAGSGWSVATPDGAIESDAVILATPAYVTADLLAEAAPGPATTLAAVPYASTALVLALVDLGDDDLEGTGFLVPPTADAFIKASTFASNKWPWMRRRIPAGTALVRMSVGRFGDAPGTWQDLDDAELTARAFADWQAITGRSSDRILTAEVRRWDRALPQYVPGHLDAVDDLDEELAGIEGLELVGSAYSGVGIPACIGRAHTVADRLMTTDSPDETKEKQ